MSCRLSKTAETQVQGLHGPKQSKTRHGMAPVELELLVLLGLEASAFGTDAATPFTSYVPSDTCFSSHQLLNTSLVLVHLTDRAHRNVPAAREPGKARFWIPPWQGRSRWRDAPDIGGQISLGSQKEWQKRKLHKTLRILIIKL